MTKTGRESILKVKIKLLIFAILITIILTSCVPVGYGSANVTGNPNKGKKISVLIGSEPSSIDPALSTALDCASLINHAFEGLTSLDENGIPQNAQAKDIKISEDGLTYTIVLRDDLYWSDGNHITTEDFVYSWKRVVTPDTASQYAYMMDIIENANEIMEGKLDPDNLGIKAIDDKTLEVKLISPCPYFKELLAFPTYMPVRSDIVDIDESWTLNPNTYIGNGPYKMVSWSHNDCIVYQKNEFYYNSDKLGPDQIRFILSEDDNAVLQAFRNGDICFTDKISNAEINAWKSKPEYHVQDLLATYFVCFQVEKEPFNDKRVRKALSLAIDRNYITQKVTKVGQNPAGGLVPDGMFDADPSKTFRDVGGDYYPIQESNYEDNIKEAQKLLAEAGYPGGKGFPAFNYMYNPTTPNAEVAEALQDMWKQNLGITSTLSSQDWAVLLATRQAGNYQLSRHSWTSDFNDPISFLDLWVTNGGNNDAKWSNSEYDALIKKVKLSNNQEERFKLMHEAESILMDEMPIIPIYFNKVSYLMDTRLNGAYTMPLGYYYFMNAVLED